MLVFEIRRVDVVAAPVATGDGGGDFVDETGPRIRRADVEVRHERIDLPGVPQHRPDRVLRILGKADHETGDDANPQSTAHFYERALLVIFYGCPLVFDKR